jgi:membrane protein required for colicin V production
MNLIDIVIVLILVLSAVFGFRSGLIRCISSLVGLIAGISIASWNYKGFAFRLMGTIHSQALAEAISFCLIALIVMIVAALIGLLLKSMIHGIGLAWLDRLLGLIFGLLRGAVLVSLCIIVLAAFFPETLWLGNSQLSRYFLGSVDITAQVSPGELKDKILNGLHTLEKDTPNWLSPK